MPEKIIQKFIEQYGEEKGRSIYYATAKKLKRNPETFKKTAGWGGTAKKIRSLFKSWADNNLPELMKLRGNEVLPQISYRQSAHTDSLGSHFMPGRESKHFKLDIDVPERGAVQLRKLPYTEAELNSATGKDRVGDLVQSLAHEFGHSITMPRARDLEYFTDPTVPSLANRNISANKLDEVSQPLRKKLQQHKMYDASVANQQAVLSGKNKNYRTHKAYNTDELDADAIALAFITHLKESKPELYASLKNKLHKAKLKDSVRYEKTSAWRVPPALREVLGLVDRQSLKRVTKEPDILTHYFRHGLGNNSLSAASAAKPSDYAALEYALSVADPAMNTITDPRLKNILGRMHESLFDVKGEELRRRTLNYPEIGLVRGVDPTDNRFGRGTITVHSPFKLEDKKKDRIKELIDYIRPRLPSAMKEDLDMLDESVPKLAPTIIPMSKRKRF